MKEMDVLGYLPPKAPPIPGPDRPGWGDSIRAWPRRSPPLPRADKLSPSVGMYGMPQFDITAEQVWNFVSSVSASWLYAAAGILLTVLLG